MVKKVRKKIWAVMACLICPLFLNAQTVEEHIVNIGQDPSYIENNHFKQGSNVNPKGKKFDLNNYYLRQGGKPILPIMGEFHYSRYPRAEWEEALLQMKAAGIQIIATYCFWLHHEEQEGKFRFEENRDVRYFIELCAKHHLMVLMRIGPWAHGEARNGGYPDWYVKKRLKSGTDRSSTNGSIQPEVAAWYSQLAKQFDGLYYKDGGPIIGIQLDNEVRSTGPQNSGYLYMAALKKLAVSVGMDVPFYVVTGWPGPIVPEDEVLPLWGGYADAPWTQNIKELPANNLYQFITDRRDKNIGNDLVTQTGETDNRPVYRHPFLTVEMGPGIQDTYLRRPVLDNKDMLGMLYTRLGTGANMLGYYIFHGTQHPLSWDKTYSTQESKSNIYPYPNDYPLISYDFQAPIGEWGYLQEHYHDLKLLHEFITDYGAKLAPMFSTVPADNPQKADDLQNLRYAVRNKGNSGFVFFNNYVRHYHLAEHPDAAFTIKTPGETIRIPEKKGIDIKDGVEGLLLFNLDAGGVLIKYATVHPAAIIGNTYFYYAQDGVAPEIKLDHSNIKTLVFKAGRVGTEKGFVYLSGLLPGKNCVADITTKKGNKVRLVVLTHEQAKYSYVFNIKGVKTLLLTDKQAFYDDLKDHLTIRSIGESSFKVDAFPALSSATGVADGIFKSYGLNVPKATDLNVAFKQVSNDSRFTSYTASHSETPAKPNYSVKYSDTLPYKTYSLSLPKMPAGVYDELIEINYEGNTAGLYSGEVIVADDYYNGKPMYYSLKRGSSQDHQNSLLLQISPLLSKPNIYFEPGTPLSFKDGSHAALKSIRVKPVYQVIL